MVGKVKVGGGTGDDRGAMRIESAGRARWKLPAKSRPRVPTSFAAALQAAHQPLQLSGPRQGRIANSSRPSARKHDMPTVTEVMDPHQVPLVVRYADMLQIGTRDVQNFDLLKEVGQTPSRCC